MRMSRLNELAQSWRDGWNKNRPDLTALIRRRYPPFVTQPAPGPLDGEIPVFNFHAVTPSRFEAHLAFLSTNGYRTLSADELESFLVGRAAVPRNSVVLTFDDGHRSLWTVAHPLLKRYGFHAVAFVISSAVETGDATRPTLEDAWNGRVEGSKMALGAEEYCNWAELRAMQASGTVDLQSHSANHARICVSAQVQSFVSPETLRRRLRYDLPVYRMSGRERWDRVIELGTPIYENRPRLSGRRRFLDDESLRERCVNFVAEHGGAEYFQRTDARGRLSRLVEDHLRSGRNAAGYESDGERTSAMLAELEESKRVIESHIPGHRVRHFAYPWWSGCDEAVSISKTVGYATNFWGILENRRSNRRGQDPFRVVRLLDCYLFRLPGQSRKSLASLWIERLGAEKSSESWATTQDTKRRRSDEATHASR